MSKIKQAEQDIRVAKGLDEAPAEETIAEAAEAAAEAVVEEPVVEPEPEAE
jgi:hypothetical protein